MNYDIYRPKERNSLNLRKYFAIILDIGSASVITAGIIAKDYTTISIGFSAGFPLLFYSFDVFLEQRQAKKREIRDITRLLEEQILFE